MAAEPPLPPKTAVQFSIIWDIWHLRFFNNDTFEILQVSRKNRREIWKKKLYSDEWKWSNLARRQKQNCGGKRWFSAGATVPPPFLHNSKLFYTKATAVPKFRPVTLLWAEIMRVFMDKTYQIPHSFLVVHLIHLIVWCQKWETEDSDLLKI